MRVPWEVQPATEPFLHPGRSARVLAAGEDVGWIGELHPLVARAWDLDQGAALFEVDFDRVVEHADAVPHYVDLTSFPELRMDLSLTLAEDVAAATAAQVERRFRDGVSAGEVPSDFPASARASQVMDLGRCLTMRAQMGTPRKTLFRDAEEAADLVLLPRGVKLVPER